MKDWVLPPDWHVWFVVVVFYVGFFFKRGQDQKPLRSFVSMFPEFLLNTLLGWENSPAGLPPALLSHPERWLQDAFKASSLRGVEPP